MAVPLEKFVQQLEDSGILAGDTLKDFLPPKASPKSAEELALELVRDKKLTKFQAEEVSKGKGKSLVLANYVLMERIGAGGMGQVFKAQHRVMERVVAVKLLPPAMTKDQAAIARFHREVKAAAKLRHPNIIAADDADQANGVHFLVMEYVDGSDLSALIKKNGAFPVEKAVDYILQAARGLEFAHKKGVVHRDIKPANLLLDSDGTVKILDMGLARIHGDKAQAELTSTGAVMGTVDYMAPEQALNTKTADARADIYSLGCSLYYLLTASATYDGDTLMAKLLAHRDQPIPSLRSVRSEVSEPLELVFKKMVAKSIDDRFQTMTEVISALESCSDRQANTTTQGMTDPGLVNRLRDKSISSAGRTMSGQTSTRASDKSRSSSARQSPGSLAGDVPADVFDEPSPVGKSLRTKRPANRVSTSWMNAFQKDRKTQFMIGGGLLGFVLLFAVVIMTLQGRDTRLVVTVNEPDAIIEVLNQEGHVEVTRKGDTAPIKISIEPGKHRLQVQKDGFEFFTEEFEIKKGNETAIAAKLLPVITRAAGSKTVEQARQAAESLLRKGGQLWNDVAGKEVEILNASQLPPDIRNVTRASFTHINLAESDYEDLTALSGLRKLQFFECPVGDAGLKYIARLTGLVHLMLNNCGVTDKGLHQLRPLSNLEYLDLNHQRITDDGLAAVAQMPKLNSLAIMESLVTDKGLIHIRSLPLRYLDLSRSGITDTGVADIARLGDLEVVSLAGTRISDASVARIKSLSKLNQLYIGQTGITSAGVAALKEAFPKTAIYADSPAAMVSGIAPPPAKAPFDATQARKHQEAWAAYLKVPVKFKNSLGMEFTLIPPGEFMMGCDAQEIESIAPMIKEENDREWFLNVITASKPRHLVRITRPFYMQTREVSNGLYQKVLGELPELNDPAKPDSPVMSNVSLVEATAFCDALSRLESKTPAYQIVNGNRARILDANGYRLPTEAEWEYACRAGTTTWWFFGVDAYMENLRDHQTFYRGAATKPNPFGLFEMYGGSDELCFDRFVPYGADTVNDPFIQPDNTEGVLRGGSGFSKSGTDVMTVNSVARLMVRGVSLDRKWHGLGRVVLPIEMKIETNEPMAAVLAASPGKLFMHDPAFTQWMKDVQAMPAEKQVEAVSRKLVELNPRFDGKLWGINPNQPPLIENGLVTILAFFSENVTDISPVRALSSLKIINCSGSFPGHGDLRDLSPLSGMKLVQFICSHNTGLSDLSPLQGMPLVILWFPNTQVSDLSPLKGMRLQNVICDWTAVNDLSALKGMPLEQLNCGNAEVSDHSPLKELPLKVLYLDFKFERDADVIRSIKTLEKINEKSVAELWKAYNADEFGKPKPLAIHLPGFDQWVKEVQALPAEKQLEAVRKKLVELNPEFDGTLKGIFGPEAGIKYGVSFLTDKVSDISPIRAMSGLTALHCVSLSCQGLLTDIRPLQGLPLKALSLDGNTNLSDFSPLQGMPLTLLNLGHTQAKDLTILKGMQLTSLNLYGSPVRDVSPLKGMPLNYLHVGVLPRVKDLSPLKQLPLKYFFCSSKAERELELLRSLKTLEMINEKPVAEFWKEVEEQQKRN